MSEINDVVVVNITRETKGVTQVGFGIPLVLGYHHKFPERVKVYSSFDAVKEDFSSNDLEYKKAQALFSQDLSPEQIIIGRASANANILISSLDVTEDYEFKLNGTTISYTPAPTDTKADVVDGLVAAVLASGEPVTPVDNGDDFDLIATVAGVDFTIESSDTKMTIRTLTQAATINFDIDFVTGNTINLNVNGHAIDPVPFNTTHAQTLTDLATAIQALDIVSACTVTGAREVTIVPIQDVIVLVTDIAVTGGASQAVGTFAANTTYQNETPVTALTTITNENNDWYFLIYAQGHYDSAGVKLLAADIETKLKLFFALSFDPRTITSSTDDLASELQALNYDRTIVAFTKVDDNHIEAAWIGLNAPKDPGSITWKFKTLSGVTADDYTDTEKTNVKGKNANLYNEIGGIDIMEEGVVISGEYIDVMRGVDWIQARIEEKVYSTLAASDKVPYTDAGVDIVKSDVNSILRIAIGQGILADDPAPAVTAPDVADIPTADKQARILRDVEFTATLAGAIHKVYIDGFVSV